jgi:hypothetical protein
MPRPLLLLLAVATVFHAHAASAEEMEGLGAASALIEAARGAGRTQARGAATPAPAVSGRAAAAHVDLSAQTGYPQGAPNQGRIGDCHEFASVALLNAAYFRQFGRSVRFSPADLFVTSVLLAPGYHPYIAGFTRTSIDESANVADDLAIAVESGVAADGDLPYAVFERRYMETVRSANQRDIAEGDRDGSLTALANMMSLAFATQGTPEGEASLQAWGKKAAEKSNAQVRRNFDRVTTLFSRHWPEANRDRERYKAEFAAGGFRPKAKPFPADPSDAAAAGFSAAQLAEPQGGSGARLRRDQLTPRNCAFVSRPQRDYLRAQLDAGMPVGVTLDLAGYAEWGQQAVAPGQGSHAVVVDGYDLGPRGLVFKTLNSWGPGRNMPLPEDALCRVSIATTLRANVDGAP